MQNPTITQSGKSSTAQKSLLQFNKSVELILNELVDTPIFIADQKLKFRFVNNNAKKILKTFGVKSELDHKITFTKNGKKVTASKIIQEIKNNNTWKCQIQYSINRKEHNNDCIVYLIYENSEPLLLIRFDDENEGNDFEPTLTSIKIISSIVSSFPCGLYLYDTETKKITIINNYLEAALGYKGDKKILTKLSFEDLVDENDYKNLLKKFRDFEKVKDDEYFETTISLKQKNNSWRIFRNYSSVFQRKPNGTITKFWGFLEDINEKKSYEKYLQLAADNYINLFNNVGEPIFILDANANILDINQSALNLFGYPKNQLINKPLSLLSVPSKFNYSEIKQKIKKALGGEYKEYDFIAKDINSNIIERNLKFYRGNYFGNDAVIVFCIDKSETILSQRALKESEESYKSLIESSLDAIYVLKDRRLLLVNQAWLDMFGYTAEEVYDDNFDIIRIVAPSSRPMIFDKLNKNPKKNVAKSRYEMQGITKDGKIIDLDVSVGLVNWKGHLAYQGVYRNITEKRRAENDIKAKDILLESTAKATHKLLTQPDIESAINSAFEIIGRAVEVSRIYIFENYDSANEHFMRQRFEWVDGKVSKEIENKELQKLSYKRFPGWYGQLSSGSFINGFVKNFPLSVREVLEPEKILSILIVPIIVNRKFWGFIGFDECKYEREWTDSEIAVLMTAGNSIGNALVRKFAEQALSESEERYRFLFDQAADLILIVDLDNNIININKRVESETGWPQDSLINKNILQSNLFTANSKKILIEHLSKPSIDSISEIEIINKNGSIIPFEINTIHLYKNGNLIGTQAIFRNIKERKENEKFLRESEEKYRNIFENVQDIFFQTDLHGKITTISPSIERYSGYKPEELIGKKVISFYATPTDRTNLLKEMQEKGEVVDFIVRLRNKENKTVYVSVNSHMLRNKYGEIIGVEGSLRDVTEREFAYDEIRKLSRAVEQSPNTVTITDTNGKLVYVNPKFTESTGYLFAEVVGRTSSFLKSGEMNNEQYDELWKTISSGKEWKGEFHNKKKNGELFWEAASISPIKNENGEITHYLAIKEDITEKKLQERRLHKYQSLLKGVSESVQSLISEKDFNKSINKALEALGKGAGADRVYIFENVHNLHKNEPSMELKYDWHIEGASDIIDNDFMNNLSSGNSRHALRQSINNNSSFSMLAKQMSEQDQAILKQYGTLSLLIVPIYVEKQFWGFIGFDNCHGEESWSESEESILNAAAASIGRAIEREKTNAELIRAKEEAEKAERLKSEFLAQISHEIRSPLNVLLNYSQLFREIIGDKIDPEIFQGFDGMENAGNRIIRTIDLLLNISELQTGSYSYRATTLDMYSEVIFPLFQEYKKIARGKNIIFNIIRHTDNTKITGDEYSITQIFANLIDNAIKYTNEGKIEIFIDRNFNNKLFIKVTDSGIGISENYLPQMYSPFSQEEQGYTRSYEGNGLGLALVKKYCELNNAEIFVDSVKGKGTTFTIIFNLN